MTTAGHEPNEHPELQAAKRDPRLDRPRGATIGDFHDYLAEAERVRRLHIWSLHEMRQALVREGTRLEAGRSLPDLREDVAATLVAAAERAQLAEAEIANDHPYVNGTTLVGMHGALDALVDELAPATSSWTVDQHARAVVEQARTRHPELTEALSPEVIRAVQLALRDELAKQVPKIPRLWGHGVERWERLLRPAGLGAPTMRAIPPDLDQALKELTNLRDVLVHRAGRLDSKAVRACPSLTEELHFREGHLVRLRRPHYRRYSAAVRAYGAEIIRRTLARGGMDYPVDLANWEDCYVVGA